MLNIFYVLLAIHIFPLVKRLFVVCPSSNRIIGFVCVCVCSVCLTSSSEGSLHILDRNISIHLGGIPIQWNITEP